MAHPREGWQGHGVPRKLTRRSFLGRSAGAALAALAGGSLLDACASGLTGSGALPLPRPNQPGAVAALLRQQRHRLGPGPGTGGHAPGLQLGRLRQPGLREQLRQEVQVQGTGHHVQHHGRGDREAAQRAELRRPDGRHRGRARPAHRVQAGPADQPLLHPGHRPGLVRLHQPLLRPGLAVHGAVHDLHDGHVLA